MIVSPIDFDKFDLSEKKNNNLKNWINNKQCKRNSLKIFRWKIYGEKKRVYRWLSNENTW